MHAFAIALVIFSADQTENPSPQIPEKYRTYFEAADFHKPVAIAFAEAQLEEVRAKKRNPEEAKKWLAALKKDQAFDYLPERPEPGQMGRIDPKFQPFPGASLGGGWHVLRLQIRTVLVCQGINTLTLPRQPINDTNIWEVSDVPYKKIPELAKLNLDGVPHAILKKVNADELSKYRKMWDALPKTPKVTGQDQAKLLGEAFNDIKKMQKKQK